MNGLSELPTQKCKGKVGCMLVHPVAVRMEPGMRKETHLSSRYHLASFEKMCGNVSTHSDQTIKGIQIPISHSLFEIGPVSSSYTGS